MGLRYLVPPCQFADVGEEGSKCVKFPHDRLIPCVFLYGAGQIRTRSPFKSSALIPYQLFPYSIRAGFHLPRTNMSSHFPQCSPPPQLLRQSECRNGRALVKYQCSCHFLCHNKILLLWLWVVTGFRPV